MGASLALHSHITAQHSTARVCIGPNPLVRASLAVKIATAYSLQGEPLWPRAAAQPGYD